MDQRIRPNRTTMDVTIHHLRISSAIRFEDDSRIASCSLAFVQLNKNIWINTTFCIHELGAYELNAKNAKLKNFTN